MLFHQLIIRLVLGVGCLTRIENFVVQGDFHLEKIYDRHSAFRLSEIHCVALFRLVAWRILKRDKMKQEWGVCVRITRREMDKFCVVTILYNNLCAVIFIVVNSFLLQLCMIEANCLAYETSKSNLI